MRVRLLGTGSADGWPHPWCTCASCAALRRAGQVRAQTAALVDGSLVLDCGPDVPRTAQRLGLALDRLVTVLLTSARPEACGPAALRGRREVPGLGPLEVAGPAEALAACRPWVRRGDHVSLREIAAGEEVVLASGHAVRALSARDERPDPDLLYDVTSPAGGRLLYAPVAAPPLPPVPPQAAYDIVLLDCTDGDGPPSADHHDLAAWAESVARLRRAGAVHAGTALVPVQLGHHNPPPPELPRRFTALGAVVLDDGDLVPMCDEDPGMTSEVAPVPPYRLLVTGGTRSGKSAVAEQRLAAEPAVTYVATALPRPADAAWDARVAAHRARRPAGWETRETLDLGPLLAESGRTLLIDSATLWLAAHLDAPELSDRVDGLVEAWRTARARVVLVTDEVGSGVHPASEAGRRFADELGLLNARLASYADEVLHVVAGIPSRLR